MLGDASQRPSKPVSTGLQVAGKNFLVPVEANPSKEADVYLQMIDTSIVLSVRLSRSTSTIC
jgi:hypothetical protein